MFLCKFCGGKCSKGIVLSLWTSSFFVTNLLKLIKSQGFYQFTAKGSDYRLINSLVSSDRNWKTEFFFVSGFWSGHPVEVGRDTFAPYTGELGNLHPEGMFMFCFVVLSVFVFLL